MPERFNKNTGLTLFKISEEQVGELADILSAVLRKPSSMMKNIPYNIVLHTAPFHLKEERHYHWRLEILRRLIFMAGFELRTGCFNQPDAFRDGGTGPQGNPGSVPDLDEPAKEVHHIV